MKTTSFTQRLNHCLKTAFPKGLKTAWWLIKITVPVSFGVMLLDYFGVLGFIAGYTGPLFRLFGLPGVSAIVFITGIFTNVYSVVAVIAMLGLPVREGTILAVMCLVSHGFLIESAVMKRTGSSVVRMVFLRLTGSFVAAWILNISMSGSMSPATILLQSHEVALSEAVMHWLTSISATVLKILILVNVLLVFQQLIEEFGWIKAINKPLSPLMKLFGLPESATFSWVVANLIGLAYGSAVMIDQREKGKMSREDADLLNHHVAVSHSQLEDPLLFLTLGYTMHWLIWPRIVIAFFAVWIRKASLMLKEGKLQTAEGR